MAYLRAAAAALAALACGALASPTCALNGAGTCPPPQWPAQWSLNYSTIVQPGGPNPFTPPASQPWGLVSLDWSVGENVWLAPNRNQSTCEATSIANARAIKGANSQTRVFIYHNMELALQWLETQRAVMYDPTKADWFLQYTDGNGHKNGTIYNEPRGEGDQFFWDFRNPDAAAYYVSSIVNVVSDPAVDGTFTDDVTGLPAEHPEAPANCRLSAAEVAELQNATQATSQALITALVKAGKYNWQAFGAQDGVGGAPSAGNCASTMRSLCAPTWQARPYTMAMNGAPADANQTVAAFLITRGPSWWLGWGWESDQRNWLPIFQLDVGQPTGACVEGPTGVFTRTWSRGTATLDCNKWVADLPFPMASSAQ